MKSKKLIVLSLLLIVCLLAGCGSQVDTSESVNTSKVEEGSSVTEEDANVQIADKPSSYDLDLISGIEGNVSFDENQSKTASVDFLGDGQKKSVVLEDENGLTWKLAIPPNALIEEQTITMTAVNNIKSSLGELSGGVVLKPDGLKFIVPVTLSVKGRDIEKSGFIFSGNGTGEKLEFANAQRSSNTLDMQLHHFSSAFAVPPSDEVFEKYTKMADKQRNSAEAAARGLLRKPIEVSTPPSIPLKCHHDTEANDDFVLGIFIEEFNRPEHEVINALLSSAKSRVLLTGDEYDPEYKLELRLLNRLIKKANALLDKYRGQDDRYIPVVRAALNAEKNYMLLGGNADDVKFLLPKASAWAKEIADKYLKELIENHDYRNIHPVMKIAREAALFGANMGSFDEELKKALSFKLEYTNKINPGKEYSYEFEVKGEAPIDMTFGKLLGTGSGNYTKFSINDPESISKMSNMSATFPINVVITDFMPCESDTFNIYIDRFGAESEYITIDSSDPEVPPKTIVSEGMVHKLTSDLFQENKEESRYKFAVALKNGQKNAAEQNFTGTVKVFDVDFTLKLIHTPEG